MPFRGFSLPLGALESRAATKDPRARCAARVALLPLGEIGPPLTALSQAGLTAFPKNPIHPHKSSDNVASPTPGTRGSVTLGRWAWVLCHFAWVACDFTGREWLLAKGRYRQAEERNNESARHP